MNKDKDINKANNDNNTYLEKIVKASPKKVAKNKIKPKKKVKKKIDEKTKLSVMQLKFVHEYVISGNATEAAIKAGYSKKTAGSQGNDLLKRPHIKDAIKKRLSEIEDAKIAKADEVLKFITSVIRGEIEDSVVVAEGTGKGRSKAVIINKPAGLKERLSAAEKLMKRYGLLTEKFEVKDTSESKSNQQHEQLLSAIKGRVVEGFNDDE